MNLQDESVSVLEIKDEQSAELARLGIESIADLLSYFPFRYDDFRRSDLVQALPDERVTVQGNVVGSVSLRWFGKKKSRLSIKLQVAGQTIQICWFNQAYLKKKLIVGETIAVSGKWNPKRKEIIAERTFLTSAEQQKQLDRFEPVYSITSTLKMNWLRKLIFEAFRRYGRQIEEVLPEKYCKQYKLMPRAQAMYYLHFPKNRQAQHQARRRMVYEELFVYECRLMWRKRKQQQITKGVLHQFPQAQVEAFVDQLPFPLTGAQRHVVDEILGDLRTDKQMNRLLQGDVGSGKTVVAGIALYANFLSGYQGALMVPTEILADQHVTSLKQLLEPLGVRIITLTGSMKAKAKREALAAIESGKVDLVVGTHALIQEPVVFSRLGLIITDEQHRFGVKQRASLREKGITPDVLCMTATPIPRTLAITYFGEMDVSTIDELPKGRQPIETYWTRKDSWSRVINYMRKACTQGFQVYVICPLIAESEKIDLQNAVEVFEQLTTELAPIRVGLLHGQMSSEEKDEVMKLFANNTVQLLVATTVVEVGVNVPNATLMVIYDADRFGLAQLHQLRGRVGRGQQASTCVLLADPKSEAGVARMRIMTESTDGFEISKQDLRLRGPGDFLGIKQSGLPDFKVADLESDQKVLEIARSDATEWVDTHVSQPDSMVPLIRLLEEDLLIEQFD